MESNIYYQYTPLTGRCLKAFIEWYKKEYSSTSIFSLVHWDSLPFEMQFTVYDDFFLSLGIHVKLEEFFRLGKIIGYQPVVNNTITQDPMPIHLARVEVIKEANDEYNRIK